MKLMTGIAMAASDAAQNSDSERGFQIKYYTFAASYQNDQGNYTIAALPFSRKENGRDYIPAAFDDIRSLAKRSNGALVRYSSDDNARWQEYLAQYGILQTEWSMIEKLNSNEDGLSKYFSGMKTSDAVLDKLILPFIEEKQRHSTSKEDDSLETMLISYAKQFSRQQDMIEAQDAFKEFLSQLQETKTEAQELWKENDELEQSVKALFAYADALDTEIENDRAQTQKNEEETAALAQNRKHIEWEKASAEFYAQKEVLERKTENLHLAEAAREKAREKAEQARKRWNLLRSAYYYAQRKEIENKITAVQELIRQHEEDSENADRLAALKYSARMAVGEKLAQVEPAREQALCEQAQCEAAIGQLEQKLLSLQEALEKAKLAENRAEALWAKQAEENDASARELGMTGERMLDGSYPEEELHDWENSAQKKKQALQAKIETAEQKLQTIETRKEVLPTEIARAEADLHGIEGEEQELEARMEAFRSVEARMKAVAQKHGLGWERRFTSDAAAYLNEQVAAAEAQIAGYERRIEQTGEELEAVRRGTLHIPKLLLQYLDGTGLRYKTVEKYLLAQREKGLLSEENCRQLLERYPYAAYGVIVEEADRAVLLQEAQGEWLPAVLPVFTASDIEGLLRQETAEFSAVAAYSQRYFRDPAAYGEELEKTLQAQTAHKKQLEERQKSLQDDKLAAEEFSAYDEAWEAHTAAGIDRQKGRAAAAREGIASLQAELETLKKQAALAKEEIKQLENGHREVCSRLMEFAKLQTKLQEEKTLLQQCGQAKRNLREQQEQEAKAASEKEALCEQCRQLENRAAELTQLAEMLRDGLKSVEDAAAAERVAGEWDELLTQYKMLMEAQSASLAQLNREKERLYKEEKQKREELQRLGCEQAEYEHIVYTREADAEAEKESDAARQLCRENEAAYTKAASAQSAAEAFCESAKEKLAPFGGAPLPPGEIGGSFEARLADISAKLAELAAQRKALENRLLELQKAQGRAEAAAETYERPAAVGTLALEADYAAQLGAITRKIRHWQKTVAARRDQVEQALAAMAKKGGAVSPDIRVAADNMHELLVSDAVRGDRYFTLCEHIDASIHMTVLRLAKIETDLKDVRETGSQLTRQCLLQGRQMHEGLLQLSSNSRIQVQGKRRPMLKFDIPESVNEETAERDIAAEIERGTKEIAAKMAEENYAESEVRRIASRTVGSKRLLWRYIHTENIVMKAYKIDRNPENSGYRTWEQTQVNNSGAEKFVVYFAVILALMAYARDGYDDMEQNRSVLILDNPFGPISSRHVLEPMFAIAKNYHVQMICLSDISKSDIVSCFDLVIRAVVKRFALSSDEQLTHEGNEAIEHGFYRSEQCSMFS